MGRLPEGSCFFAGAATDEERAVPAADGALLRFAAGVNRVGGWAMTMTERRWTRREQRDGVTEDGYGRHEVRPGQWALAHELAWAIANQSYGVPEGYTVVQTCGQRICVNPEHLELAPDERAEVRRAGAEAGCRLRMSRN